VVFDVKLVSKSIAIKKVLVNEIVEVGANFNCKNDCLTEEEKMTGHEQDCYHFMS
jgi:hypothetical protein